ncbi:hypothetical protein SNK03_011754 [Fusarium graminearum]
MAEIIVLKRLLEIQTLQHYTKWGGVVLKLDAMKVIHEGTGMPTSMSAPDLALIIAAIVFRRIKPQKLKSLRIKNGFVEFFGHLNGMQWLPVAIRVNKLVGNQVFAIELDQEATEPKVRYENINCKKATVMLGCVLSKMETN